VGTFLVFSYQQGIGIFKSESASTICILKDVISTQASLRNAQINMSLDYNAQSVNKVLELLAPKFTYYHTINQNYQLLIALRELASQVSL
jgi:hypothetical protein